MAPGFPPDEPNVERELKRPKEAVEDLAPDEHTSDQVKGGATVSRNSWNAVNLKVG